MTEEKEYVEIKYFFTQDEKNKLAFSLAERSVEKSELEEEKKASASQYKAKIDGVAANIHILSRHIKDGWEHRKVYATKRKNLLAGIWEWIDPETGEVIKSERLVGKDMQLSLDEQRAYEEQMRQQNEPIDVEPDSQGPFLLGSGELPPADEPEEPGHIEDIEHEDVQDDDPEVDPDPLDDEQPEEKPKKPRGRPRRQ